MNKVMTVFFVLGCIFFTLLSAHLVVDGIFIIKSVHSGKTLCWDTSK